MARKGQTRVVSTRIDGARLRLDTPSGYQVDLFATPEVPIDRASVAEVAAIGEIDGSIRALDAASFFGDRGSAGMGRCILTPDFHRGSGIPVGTVMETRGFVLPRSAGNDIGCGMRLLATNLDAERVRSAGGELDRALREIFFGGRRDIAFDERGREGILRHGVQGLRRPTGASGLWRFLSDQAIEAEAAACHGGGRWPTRDLWAFGDYVRGSGGTSRDAHIGSVGGGNHFVEIQTVDAVLDRRTAWAWGLRPGQVVVMVHSGSLGLGGMVATHFLELAKSLQPRGMPLPGHGFHPLPTQGPLAEHGKAYLNAMGLAANFAVVNRLMMGLMAIRGLSEALGHEVQARTVYDAAHNVVWPGTEHHIHRKGACPAGADDGAFLDGHPVIVPGSMGASSWLLRGLDNAEALSSAPHGAGRVLARGEVRRAGAEEIASLRVVTPLDPLRVRGEVARRHAMELMEEAPSAYKPVMPVIETVERAGMAVPVARMLPILTIKG